MRIKWEMGFIYDIYEWLTVDPSINPTSHSTVDPTINPTLQPTVDPTINQISQPTLRPISTFEGSMVAVFYLIFFVFNLVGIDMEREWVFNGSPTVCSC